ncbi:MAG: phosphatase PAP2 family protein [Verrucomicrobiales bacterium]|nr:phosphatase PAP2 family protein [Verrucomicrobiales bacterium]
MPAHQPFKTHPALRSRIFSGYGFTDCITQSYLATVGLLILIFHNDRVPTWPVMAAWHVAGLLAIHLLIRLQARFQHSLALDFLRHFYPILLYTALYHETGLLNQLFGLGYLDASFFRMEQSLFGWQPGIELMQRFPQRGLAELLLASYFCYYLMVGGVGLALFLRNRRQFDHFLAVISFVFYVCYFIYIFTPVVGPRILLPGVVAPLPDGLQQWPVPTTPLPVQEALFFRLMAWIYANFEVPGAAFPSSHVAVALATAWFSFRYLRPIRWLHLGVALLLCIATVYGRYHYVIDVLAGIATAVVLVPAGNWLHRKFSGAPPADSSRN